MKIILASASPRRKDILSMLGVNFEIIPADIDESPLEKEDPHIYVERLSIQKALKISAIHPDCMIIGSDLTVDLDGEIYGKAENKNEARSFLEQFSGKTHMTHCGYAIIHNNRILSSGVASTFITFRKLSESDILKYLESNEWMGLAGAYGVQGGAAKFVEKFKGSYFDILGLPIYEIIANFLKFRILIYSKNIQDLIDFDITKREELNRKN